MNSLNCSPYYLNTWIKVGIIDSDNNIEFKDLRVLKYFYRPAVSKLFYSIFYLENRDGTYLSCFFMQATESSYSNN